MIGDGAGLVGWWIGLGIGIGIAAVRVATGVAMRWVAAGSDPVQPIVVPDPGLIHGWDVWEEFDRVAAEKEDQG